MGTRIFTTALSAMGAVLGLAMLATAFLLTEPEERKIQSTLETWWIILDDIESKTSKKLRSLARAASDRVLRALEIVFGPKLSSPRAIWPASCLAAGFVLVGEALKETGVRYAPVEQNVSLIVGILFFGVAFAPLSSRLKPVTCGSCLLLVVSSLTLAAFAVLHATRFESGTAVFVNFAVAIPSVILGTGLHLLWAAYLRWVIPRFKEFVNLGRTLCILLITAAVLVVSVTVPIRFAVHFLKEAAMPQNREHFLALFSIGWAFLSIGKVAVTAAWPIAAYFVNISLYLVQRLMWPIVPRMIYAAQRHRFLQQRGVIAKLGIALLIASGIRPIVELVDRLQKLLSH